MEEGRRAEEKPAVRPQGSGPTQDAGAQMGTHMAGLPSLTSTTWASLLRAARAEILTVSTMLARPEGHAGGC